MKFFKNKTVTKHANTAKIIILAGLVGVGVSSASAAWAPPVSLPTANNPEAPLNIGATTQTKSGGIWADFFGTLGGGYFEGNVGIGTSNPNGQLHIDVNDIGDTINWASDVMWGLGVGNEFIITNDNASINLIGVDESAFSGNITLPEVDLAGNYLDVWAIYRNTSSNPGQESKLTFGYASAADPSYSWWWGQADRLGIFPDGRVVIGDEANPSAKLHVVGDIYATGDITCGGSCAGGGGGGGLPVTDGSDWLDLIVSNWDDYSEIRWGDDWGDRLRFYFEEWGGGGSKEVMNLNADGSVNIGVDEGYNTSTLTLWSENGYESNVKLMEDPIYGMGLRYVANDNKLYFDRYNGDTWPTEAMTLRRDNGYLGIGTTDPGYELEVAGDIAYWYGLYDISDVRLKENIEKLTGALPKLEQIQGVYFNKTGELNRGREVGVIAQDVEKVLPEAVSEGEDGYKRVDYTKLVPLLIEAVKEQQGQIETLKQEVETLKSR